VILLKPLQDADVGEAASATAAERETDARTMRGLRLGGLRSWLLTGLLDLRRGQGAGQREQKEESEPRCTSAAILGRRHVYPPGQRRQNQAGKTHISRFDCRLFR
jgi:hypothetical protein